MKTPYERLFGKPMSDEVHRLADERAKMTPDEFHEYLEGLWGSPIPGDKVDREDF